MNVREIANVSCRLLTVAVVAVAFPALTAAAQSTPQGSQPSMDALRAACAADAQRLCAGVQPGGGRIVACLKDHKDALSDRCKQAAGLAANSGSSPAPGAANGLPSSGANAAASSPASSSGSASVPSTSPAVPATKAAPANAASAAVGEKFVEQVITDTEHEGMRAATIHVPEKWSFESKIEWHYDRLEVPLIFSSHAENPDNAEAYFQYPLLRAEIVDVAPQYRKYAPNKNKPGDRLPTGAIWSAPIPPMQALAKFIQQVRPNAANFKWIGQQDLPDLAKNLKMDPWPGDHGVAIKIGYDLNGQPVEEAFFGVYYISKQGTDAVSLGQLSMAAGSLQQTNWGFRALQSMRAPAGTLDKRMPMFCVIAKSIYVNPEWIRLTKAINDKMMADFNQKMKQGWDQTPCVPGHHGANHEAAGRVPGELRQTGRSLSQQRRRGRQFSAGWRQAQCFRPLGRFDPRRGYAQRSEHRRYDAALQPGPVSLH